MCMHRYLLVILLAAAACGDDDGTAIDGAPGADAEADAAADAPPGIADAPPGTPDAPPGGPTVECGTATCDVGTQHCCVEAMAGTMTFTCVDIGTACAGSEIGCDGPEDCAGEVCCAQGGGPMFETVCAAACMGMAETVCHDATTCGTGELCCADPLGFMYCYVGDVCP